MEGSRPLFCAVAEQLSGFGVLDGERVFKPKAIPMNASHLTVISPPTPRELGEPLADRIRRLQAEAQSLARDHVADLEHALARVADLAQEIAAGGDAYPIGARDLCRRLSEDSAWRAATLGVILQKN